MSTQVGQVRQHYQIKTTTEGAGLTEQHHLEGVTSEVWTGTEWVDVRELVAVVRGVLALAEEMEQAGGLPDTHGEFDRGVAAHQRDAAARIRVVLAGDS